jgi:hypothetical protein
MTRLDSEVVQHAIPGEEVFDQETYERLGITWVDLMRIKCLAVKKSGRVIRWNRNIQRTSSNAEFEVSSAVLPAYKAFQTACGFLAIARQRFAGRCSCGVVPRVPR